MPAAVLLDMNGTLVDTEPLWMAAEYELVGRYGGTWSEEHAQAIIDSDLLDAARYICARGEVDLPPEQVVDIMVAAVRDEMADGLAWRPGALDLLAALRRAGVRLALVTMSYRAIVDALLPHLSEDIFDIVVTGDEVAAGKPDPEPYLAAARALGVEPAGCVAIEDSATGTRSAEAAGCRVLVVPNHVTVEPAPGRTFAQSLAEVTPADLAALLS